MFNSFEYNKSIEIEFSLEIEFQMRGIKNIVRQHTIYNVAF